jgi:hypothetical protein
MYKIITSGDVKTFEDVFPNSDGKTRDDSIDEADIFAGTCVIVHFTSSYYNIQVQPVNRLFISSVGKHREKKPHGI